MARFYHPLFLICILFCTPLETLAKTLKGKVTDRQTGEALAGCAVYIDQSTVGTATDREGQFTLYYNGPLPVRLVFRSVGYELKAVQILPDSPEEMNVALATQNAELDEVKVLAPAPDGWERYGKDFLDNFIGYSDWGASCELVNKKDVTFRYDREGMVLTVHASAPLVIRHKQLGYTIYYDLEDFTRNYREQTVFFSGYARYEARRIRNRRQAARIGENRQMAYRGSVGHFIKALYHNNLTDAGFEVRRLERVRNADYGKYVPVWTDTLKLNQAEGLTRLFSDMMARPGIDSAKLVPMTMALKRWMSQDSGQKIIHLLAPLKDSTLPNPHHYFLERTDTPYQAIVKYFDYDRLSPADSARAAAMSNVHIKGSMPARTALPETQFDIVYTVPMVADSIRKTAGGQVSLAFEGYLQVTYTGEQEERAYLHRLSPFKELEPQPQKSIISLRQEPRRVTILPNGYYLPVYNLFLEGYWSYEKLDKQLPLDYQP